MIIERLDLIAFGHLTDRSLDLSAGPHRFHLVVGPNESGKSTSLRAITSWLFGMATRADDAFLHPTTKLRVGGRLVSFGDDAKALECIRRRGRKGTLRGPDDSTEIDEAELSRMLGGIDEAAFKTRFGLSHDELLRGGEQILRGEGELGEILFSAGAGIGRLREIHEQLETEAAAKFKRTGSRSTINESLQQIDAMRKELRAAQVPPAEFVELQKQLTDKETQIKTWRDESQSLALRRSKLVSAEQALPLIPRFQTASGELAEVIDAPLLPDDFPARRREWDQDQQFATKLADKLNQRRADLLAQLDQLSDNESLALHADEIVALYRELPTREKAEADKANLKETFTRLERHMRARLKDLALKPIGPESDSTPNDDPLGDQVDSLRMSDTQRTKLQRLAGQYEKLVQQREDAHDQLQKTRREWQLAEQALAESDTPAQFQLLDRAIDEVGSPDHWIDSAMRAEAAVQKLQHECESLHRRLKWNGDLDDATRITPPDVASIADATAALDAAEDELKLCRRRLAEAKQTLATAEEKLALLDADDGDLPKPADLQNTREKRDSILEHLKTDAESMSTDGRNARLAELQLAIRDADAIADIFQSRHEAIHRRQSAQNNVDAAERQIADRANQADAAAEILATAQAHWNDLWSPTGVKADSPDAMQAWRINHGQLIDRVNERRDAQSQRDQAHTRLRHAIARLNHAIGNDALTESSEDSPEATGRELLRLHDIAVILRNEQSQQQNKREQRLTKRDECASEIPECEQVLTKRQEALDDWNARWDEVTETLNVETKPDPQDALSMIDSITQLVAQKRERDILIVRITSITNETGAYLVRAQRLLNALGWVGQTSHGEDPVRRFRASHGSRDPNPETGASAQTVNESGDVLLGQFASHINTAHERWQQEQIARSARDEVQQQLKRCEQELAETTQQLERLRVTQDQLCEEARCDSPDQLAEIERNSQRRIAAAAKVADLQAQLDHWAGGQDRDEFVASLKNQPPAMIEEELRNLAEQKQTLDDRLATAQEELGGLRHQFQAIDGGGKASALSQQMQFSLGKLQREAEEYLRLRLATSILQRAMEHYRDQNQEPVLQQAESFFATLTCGEYQSLRVDYGDGDTPSLIGVRSNVDVPANRMSTGTADALYLSLRLASLKHQLAHSSPIPLIVDDCLIQLDDRRAAAALQVFSELSTTTQVILFTHHDHLIDLATQSLPENGFHVHHLAGGKSTVNPTSKPKATNKPSTTKKAVRKKAAVKKTTPEKPAEASSLPPETLFDVSPQ